MNDLARYGGTRYYHRQPGRTLRRLNREFDRIWNRPATLAVTGVGTGHPALSVILPDGLIVVARLNAEGSDLFLSGHRAAIAVRHPGVSGRLLVGWPVSSGDAYRQRVHVGHWELTGVVGERPELDIPAGTTRIVMTAGFGCTLGYAPDDSWDWPATCNRYVRSVVAPVPVTPPN